MTGFCTAWSLKGFLFNRYDKSAQIAVVCKGKCFCIQTSPENFEQSPESLETYVRLMDVICDDEDMEEALMAEEYLLQWTVKPFQPILDQLKPSSLPGRRLTLQDYLRPGKYRFVLHVVKEQQEPCFDYNVPREPGPGGVELHNWTLYSEWKVFQPPEIQVCSGQDEDELLSRVPHKVIADGEISLYKPLDHDDKECAVREMKTYRRLEFLKAGERLLAPRL